MSVGYELYCCVIGLVLLAVCSLAVYLIYFKEHKHFSKHLQNISAFFLLNKDLKSWVLHTDYPENANHSTLKIIIKMLDDGIKFNNLTKDEQKAVKLLNEYFIVYDSNIRNTYEKVDQGPDESSTLNAFINEPKDSDVYLKLFFFLKDLRKCYESQLDSPFRSMDVTVTTSTWCSSRDQTIEETDEGTLLYTRLFLKDIDKTGAVDLKVIKEYREFDCSVCEDECENYVNINHVSAGRYFILQIQIMGNFKGRSIEFKKKYCIKNEKGEKILPNEYEIVSLLHITGQWMDNQPIMTHLYTNTKPLILKNLKVKNGDHSINGHIYAMMKEVPSNVSV
ncbi:hypothetical protein ENBRE01_1925 [Enteropsectra breve]|nr:hypothetical protein ENBRE01_1925 [Enteropsectra breve]